MDFPRASQKQAIVQDKGEAMKKGEEEDCKKKQDEGKPMEDQHMKEDGQPIVQDKGKKAIQKGAPGNLSAPDSNHRLNREFTRQLDDVVQTPMTFEMTLNRYKQEYRNRWHWYEVESLPIFGPQGIPETCRLELPICNSDDLGSILSHIVVTTPKIKPKWGPKDVGEREQRKRWWQLIYSGRHYSLRPWICGRDVL